MDMDAAPSLKRKGADASELWLHDDGPGFPVAFRAAKSRRLDADVPPVVPGAVVTPPPPPAQTQPVVGFGLVEEAPMCGDVAGVKRKGADAPELWLDNEVVGGPGFPVAFHASKSRRLDACAHAIDSINSWNLELHMQLMQGLLWMSKGMNRDRGPELVLEPLQLQRVHGQDLRGRGQPKVDDDEPSPPPVPSSCCWDERPRAAARSSLGRSSHCTVTTEYPRSAQLSTDTDGVGDAQSWS